MENKRIESIMYMKFNNKDRHASLMAANKRGLIVINKSFKEVLNDEANKTEVDIDTHVIKESADTEVALLWQAQIHENYIKTRRELGW